MDSIDAGGGTNIWLGLEQGPNSLMADQMGGRMAHVMLLTNSQTTSRVCNMLTAFAKEVVISLETTVCEIKGVQGGYPFEPNADRGRINFSTLQYEQTQSGVVMVKPKGADAQRGGNCSSQSSWRWTSRQRPRMPQRRR